MRKRLSIPLKIVFSMIAFVTTAVIITAALLLLDEFKGDLAGAEYAIVLGIATTVLSAVLMGLLEKNKKLTKKARTKYKINLRWLVIVPVSISPGVILVVAFLSQSTIDFANLLGSDLLYTPNLAALTYTVVYLLFQPAAFLAYFGIKNLLPWKRVHWVKFPIYSTITTASLIGLISIAFFALSWLDPGVGRVVEHYEHNDGPWVTFHDDPRTSASITWLTRDKVGDEINVLNLGGATLEFDQPGVAKHLHRARLTGLSPNTTFYYTIPTVVFEQDHVSTTFSFKTAPATQQAFSFSVFGDMQPTRGSNIPERNKLVVEGVIVQEPDFFMQVGDAASTGGFITDWHLTLSSLALAAANIPMMIAVGNHDVGRDDGQNFGDMFKYPYANFSDGMYYSFNYSNAFFLVIDSNRATDSQVSWVDQELATATAAAGIDWVFCFLHSSIISSGTANTNWGLQHKLAPLFDKHAVDAVFYGHDHHYEFFNYTYGNNGLVHDPSHTWAHTAVPYFETGGGGANLEAYGYGLLSRTPVNFTRQWYNTSSTALEDITYYRLPWDDEIYIDYSADPVMSQVSPDGKVYYQDPGVAIFQEDVLHYGYVYGENSYHFMDVEINGTTCTIRALYPNGDVLSGPGGTNVQEFVLVK